MPSYPLGSTLGDEMPDGDFGLSPSELEKIIEEERLKGLRKKMAESQLIDPGSVDELADYMPGGPGQQRLRQAPQEESIEDKIKRLMNQGRSKLRGR